MTRWLLDTDHVSLHERGHPALHARFITTAPEELAVSVITVEEMIRGRLAMLTGRTTGARRVHAYAKFMETVRFFGLIQVIPYDEACEERFQALRAMRLPVGSQDMRIAATALAHHLIVVTRNTTDFGRIPGLVTEDWIIQ